MNDREYPGIKEHRESKEIAVGIGVPLYFESGGNYDRVLVGDLAEGSASTPIGMLRSIPISMKWLTRPPLPVTTSS